MTASTVGKSFWRRPQNGHCLDVLGTAKIERWRNARIARIAPIRVPAGVEPYFDTSSQKRAVIRASDQPCRRMGFRVPRGDVLRGSWCTTKTDQGDGRNCQ